MNNFNEFIQKRNFKKIFTVYFIIAVITGIVCAGAAAYVYKDKIALAVNYEKADRAFEKAATADELKNAAEALAGSSNDITDILITDSNGRYTSVNGWAAKMLDFKRTRDGYFTSDDYPDTVFKLVKKEEFMLRSVFTEKLNDDSEFERFGSQKLYTVSLLGKSKNNIKGYVISNPQPVLYGDLTLKLTASIVMLLFMIYWIIIALWVYQNAKKSKLSAPVWGIITLFTNLLGVLLYVIYKTTNGVCAYCGAILQRGGVFCTYCGHKNGVTCEKCGSPIPPSGCYCPKCGNKIK